MVLQKKKTKAATKSHGKRGRPKKVVEHSDGSDDDINDDGEHHGAGRPATGAVNLNIVRTGRGQGRPRKNDTDVKKRSNDGSPDGTPKKRGRPTSGKSPNAARGRPKNKRASSVEEVSSHDDDDDNDDNDGNYKNAVKVDDYSDEDEDFGIVDKKTWR